jgi:magnesium-transporting ATPase (P-type)
MKPSITLSQSAEQQKNPDIPANYWSLPSDQLFSGLHSSKAGLEPEDVVLRQKRYGLNSIRIQTQLSAFRLLPGQFKSSLFLILAFAAIVSGAVGEWVNAGILLGRTRHLFFRSRPGKLLLLNTLISIAIALVLPHLPFVPIFGFIPLPLPFMLAMLGLTLLHIFATELTKKYFICG